MKSTENLLEVAGLSVTFGTDKNKRNKAVNDVSFTIKKGETLGLVGESGCGKTTLGRTIIRLQKEDCGTICLENINLCKLNPSELRVTRKKMQMIFQNPYSSLNPRMTILDIIAEPLPGKITKENKRKKVAELMLQVGLDPDMMYKFPHEFSGGQRQRIAIARTVAAGPALIIADEPVSSLDVSVQAQILNVLKKLRDTLSMTMLFISHDLSVVKYISHNVAVMYHGFIVETGPTNSLFNTPAHPYTRLLLKAVPEIDPDKTIDNNSFVTNNDFPIESPDRGCPFLPRCFYAIEICKTKKPVLFHATSDEHTVACFRAKELMQRGLSI